MFRTSAQKPEEPRISLGAHQVELIPSHDTPLLSELTKYYLELKAAIDRLIAVKTKVGLLRGKLAKENQQRDTACETSVFGKDAVNRLYAFAAARAEFELELLHVQTARKELHTFLSGSLHREREPFPTSACYDGSVRYMLADVTETTPHPVQIVARHNVASSIALLSSLKENLVKYREYFRQLPEFFNVLWNAYCAHDTTRHYDVCWVALLNDK